ncbi:hypothetical protein SDRG_06527 [Saprolegnia diclina VS20]|uniref:Cilia- and flagella-associated protein 263 n=1 Tax=Saprolegnia diclina (strain VS20) TaxID=1156394 RepID=T0RTE4_SAPDV|nr:hypothetical protein SDRG_06527 [Saprolegnia diclina VS20]EQC35768.1 hypothetical protein SDRG_06527 [Saprolegnia diclina VS20]|eukprot:XP_008610530.1 hypothetical protein SDRG_06527 [Saprolegnia diclina VS20]
MDSASNDDIEELEAKLEEALRQNELLSHENELFDSFLKRNAQPTNAAEDDDKKDKPEKQAKNRQRRQRPQATITIEQKNDICSAELEEAQKEIEETKRSSERLIDTLRAVLEETDIRIAELKMDAYEFKRDIVVGAENFRTGKTIAEKMVRYMEDKLRAKDAVIEKLRLKNATLKSQAQKIDAQLRQKEEMGDALHYIDFHQLQIENKQYVAKIEERNDELLKLKQTTGNTVQLLNTLKQKLNDLIDESAWLQAEIRDRAELHDKVKTELLTVGDEISHDTKLVKSSLSAKAETSTEMPQILDFVGQKALMYELAQEVANYERKVEIAEMAAKKKARDQRQSALLMQQS